MREPCKLTEGIAVGIHEPLGYSPKVDQQDTVQSGTSFAQLLNPQKIREVLLLASLSLYNQHSWKQNKNVRKLRHHTWILPLTDL